MSSFELDEHRRYLTDDRKIAAYRAALQHHITPDSVVLDLGAGTGLLGLLAAERGAKRVYAVDDGSILRLATEMARANAFSDRIVHVKGLSTEITLPEPVDVIVCDQIGGFVYDAGVLNYYADAAARLLKPGGVLIPGSFELQLTPVAHPELAAHVADWTKLGSHGFEASVFADAAANTEHRVHATSDAPLGAAATVCALQANHGGHFGGTVELVVERAGSFCGLAGTFIAHLAPGVCLTNAPWGNEPFRRWQNLYPVRQSVEVVPGDVIEATIDVSPVSGIVAWRGRVLRAGTEIGSFRHDTLNGRFSGTDSLMRASEHWVPILGPRTAQAQRIVELADGSRSIGVIGDHLVAEFSTIFTNRDTAMSYARWVLGPVLADEDR